MRSQWVIRVSLIAVCYVVIYFTFGYFVAWRNPAVREYYHGSDPGGFLTQLKSVAQSTPWLFPFQFLRGVLWVGLALPVIWTMRDRGWQTALAVALCFSVFTAALLLLPNPLMPTEVRMAHLIETASSNFLFGLLLVAILLHQPQRAVS